MTIFDEILIAANTLANEGKKPTVALVKTRLKQHVPLPTLIQTLKNWQHDENFVAIPTSTSIDEKSNTETPLQDTDVITHDKIQQIIQNTLETELSEIKQELSDMKKLIEQMSSQLTKES